MVTVPDRPTIPAELDVLDCGGGRYCKRPAVFIAKVHCIDRCQPYGTVGQHLTQDGATILLLCRECLTATARLIGDELAARLSRLPHGFIMCRTCSRPVANLHDLLETEAL